MGKYKYAILFSILYNLCICNVNAQPSPAQLHMQQQQQMQNDMNGQRSWDEINNNRQIEADRRAQREWQIRENRILAEISQLRNTPFYGAIVANSSITDTRGGGGYKTKDLAIKRALERCKVLDCQVIATFSNTCAMVAQPENDPHNINALFIGIDKNPEQAVIKSVRACEAKYGNDKCIFWGGGKGIKGAICSGYDYGFYGKN